MRNSLVILCMLVIGLTSNITIAQMTAAKKITWDVTISTDVEASKGAVWRLLNNTSKLPHYSDGYIVKIKEIDEDTRELVFVDGTHRKERLMQLDHMYKFMVLEMVSESLPDGIEHAEIAIFTKDIDEDHSNISWNVKITGKKEAKNALKTALTTELESYAQGFRTFKK